MTGDAEMYIAVRVPKSMASDRDFLRRRAANDGHHSKATFVDKAKKYDIGAVLRLEDVTEMVSRTRNLLRTTSTDRTPSRVRA